MIIDACSGSGAWSKPFRDAGCKVLEVDIKNGIDIRLLEYLSEPVEGILAAPPCTHLSGSGARWWEEKGETALLESLSIVDACLRLVLIYKPRWWALENPVGRLVRYLGKPRMYFHPYEYAMWADNPGDEAYSKKTCLWGNFNIPEKNPVECTSQKIWRMAPSPDRSELRSITPSGFARAFFQANAEFTNKEGS